MGIEKTLSSIDVYICEKETDYAIMINGGWGSGKTYFVKNKLIDHLQSAYEKQVIYISLFGLKSVEEILQDISFHVANIIVNEHARKKARINSNQNIKSINTSASTKLGFWSKLLRGSISLCPKGEKINSIIADITSGVISFENYIFCFDDFERSTITYSELLGLIDSLAGQTNTKTMIVVNEEYIISRKNAQDYLKFKEKVVGLTINFENEMDEIFENILNGLKLKSNVSQFVQDNKDLIIETFERLESKNIRTLKFALKRFEELCKKIEEHICDKGYSINNRNNFWGIMLKRCINMSIALKDMKMNTNEIKWEEVEKLQEYNCIDKTGFQWELKSASLLDSSIWGAKFIDHYLVKYNFVDDEMFKVVESQMEAFKRRERLQELDILKEWYYCKTDKEIEDNFSVVMGKLESDKYDIDDYDTITDICFELAEKYFNDEEIKQRIKDNMEKNLLTKYEIYNIWGNKILFENKEAREYSFELKRKVLEMIRTKNNEKLQMIAVSIDGLIDRLYEFERIYVDVGNYEEQGFLSKIDTKDLENFLEVADPKDIILFRNFLLRFNRSHNIKRKFPEDMETVKVLLIKINGLLENMDISTIKKSDLIVLKSTLEQIAENEAD